jgi:Uma2 family endonuclease
MKAASHSSITVGEFLAWAQGQERGRFELFGGEIVMQQPERIAHVRVKGNIYAALRNAIERAGLKWNALTAGAMVRIAGDTAFEPDALVYCGSMILETVLEAPHPVIVVEVLCESTAVQDMGYKRRGYFSLSSVQHYLIADPERRLVLHYERGNGHEQLPRIVSEGSLSLDPPGLTVTMFELFSS